jgi:hypothetical protein
MPDALTFEQAEQRLNDARQRISDAEVDCEKAIGHAADAEAIYRQKVAERIQHYREAGRSVDESVAYARRDVIAHSRERDHAAGMLKLAHERVENARDDRRSLWRLIEWSQKAIPIGQGPA